MRFDILTLFPEVFSGLISSGVLGRAVKKGILEINLINIRDFGCGPHKIVDDRPFGGGAGMVMKVSPIYRALRSIDRVDGRSVVIMLSPQGDLFDQDMARELLSFKQIVLICGRYEGVDERVRLYYVDREISIGDYILSGGELAAMVIIDVVGRLIPGVLHSKDSLNEETLSNGLLKYPQYTRPREFDGKKVPEVLLSGDHERIKRWRRKESLKRTLLRRSELLKEALLSDQDKKVLEELKRELNIS
ncbi:MAG TPA: tRNA (guanosine(37)-N1)-methyltransferase TrmD [Desulfobacteraceae bacterium]|nr:tRNA (guanosine(37)-N1)-methyltransferase TrmD [Desulfobacteraceae bacterium]